MERAIDPLQTIDAKLWADEFMATKQRLGDAEFDHAMMLGWFANAIMRGYDEGKRLGAADAQATIAALQADNRTYINERHENMKQIEQLQARVPELEQAVKETHGRFISEQAAKKDVIEELTVALKSNADGQVLIDKLMQDVLKLEAQLTQRTAELEAAKAELNTVRRDAGLDCGDNSCLYAMNKTGMRTNGGCRCSPKRMKDDLGRSRKACDDLHAELERVRGELQSAEAGYFVAERELQGANNKYDELRTLILALPKVEGEIAVKRTEVDLSYVWGITLNGYFTFQSALFDGKEEAESYAAILKHRQGME